jgi:hypothetical protein
MEKFEFWCVVTNDAWEEAVIVGGHTAQEAEDKALKVIEEQSKEEGEYLDERSFDITPASYHD